MMQHRISDVHYKFYKFTTDRDANDRIQLEGLPTPTCWLRGVQFSNMASQFFLPADGHRFDFVTDGNGTGIPTEEEILISFPAPYYFGTQNYFFPEDSYLEILDSQLYVTSDLDDILENCAVTVYFT
ncbi:MAG: hypothetical protein CL489_16730 [Acidobacteria bacterium]|nr:hypothetical protein [Acidobacteriota bacterium]